MPGVPKTLLKCIQDQFAVERQRAVIDSLDLDEQSGSGEPLKNQIEKQLLEVGVPAGLFNIGNTCYANSAIQALMVCTPFAGYFVDQLDNVQSVVEQRQTNIGNLNDNCAWRSRRFPPYISSELRQLVSSLLLLRMQNDSFSPSHLMNAVRKLFPQFSIGSQHDAQEFISCLLDRLHEELKYPILQQVEEGGDEDDGTTSSTKSDYESCMSIVSEDSLLPAGPEEDSLMAEPLCLPEETRKVNGHAHTNGDLHERSSLASDEDLHEAIQDGDKTNHILPDSNSTITPEPLHLPQKSPSSHFHPRTCKVVTWRSIIQDLFYGDFAVTIECRNCGEVSTRYENFQMLEVSIPSVEQLAELADSGLGDDVSCTSEAKAATVKTEVPTAASSRWPKWMFYRSPHMKRRVGLMACLRNEFRPEYLTGENQYHCDHCNKATDAVKNIRISRLPEVLIIHFKRFKYETSGAFLASFTNPDRKIHDLVDFPCDELLDPTMFNVAFTTKYQLRSVISHSGSTLSSGHYTSFVKVGEHESGKWYACNDADVSEVSSSVIGDTEAYILFYSRADCEKDDRIQQLNEFIRGKDLGVVEPGYLEATSPRSLQLFPQTVFARYEQNGPLVSKEWWCKLKWSNMVHRMTCQDFLCPHQLLLPGVLNRLSDVCIPVNPVAFEKMVELFEGVNCRMLHRTECVLCAQLFSPRPNSATNGQPKVPRL